MKAKYLLLAFVLLYPSEVFSQVNIESMRAEPKQGLSGSADFGWQLNSGNVETLTYEMGARAGLGIDKHFFFITGTFAYGEEEGEPFKDEGFAHARLTCMWFPLLGTEIFSQVEYNDFKLLRRRQLNGGGLRFIPFTSDRAGLSVGLGAMADYERIEGGGGDGLVARGTSYLNGYFTIAGAKLFAVGYFQPLLEDTSDYRILSDAGVEFKILEASLINSVNYSYDTRPPDGVVRDDFTSKVTFRIRF